MARVKLNIDQCLERIGFGRFHVLALLAVCLRAFCRGSSESTLSIIEPFLRCEWNLSYFAATWVVLPETISKIFGAIIVGRLADKFGRQKIMVLVFALNSYLSLLNSLSSSIILVYVTRAATGLFSASIIVGHTYIMEILPLSKRKYMTGFKFAFSFGSAYGILTGMVTLKYLTWRWFVGFGEAIPLAVCAFLIVWLPESPRFLSVTGKHDQAEVSLKNIIKMNGKDPQCIATAGYGSETKAGSAIKKQDEPLSRLDEIKRILMIAFMRFSSYFIGGLMRFGSMQFAENAAAPECGECARNLTYKYRWAVEVGICASIAVSFVFIGKMKRLTAFRILIILIGFCIMPLYFDIRGWTLIMVTFLICGVNATFSLLGVVYQAELLPTSTRAFGVGISEASGQLGVLTGQFLALYLQHVSVYISFGLAHGIIALVFVLTLVGLEETKYKSLKDGI